MAKQVAKKAAKKRVKKNIEFSLLLFSQLTSIFTQFLSRSGISFRLLMLFPGQAQADLDLEVLKNPHLMQHRWQQRQQQRLLLSTDFHIHSISFPFWHFF